MTSVVGAILDLMTEGDGRLARALTLRATLALAGDFLLVWSLLRGLAARRAGQPPTESLVGFAVGMVIFVWLTVATYDTVNRRCGEAVRRRLLGITARLPRMPLPAYQRLAGGEVMSRLLGDTNRVASSGRSLMSTFSGVVRLSIGALFTLTLSGTAAVVIGVASLLVALTAAGRLATLRDGLDAVADDDDRLYDVLRTQIAGAVPIRLHAPRARSIGRAYSAISARVRTLRSAMFSAFYERSHAGQALVFATLGVNTFLLPLFATLDAEAVRELNIVVLWLMMGVVQVVFGLPRVIEAARALQRLDGLQARLVDDALEPPPREADDGGGPFADFRSLRMQGACFEYASTRDRAGFALGPIDLELRRGELVFVTGANGSGKSSFARLLTGLYRPSVGRIGADGAWVDDETLNAWRALFGTVFVEHRLFDRPYGLDDAALDEAPALLEEMALGDKLSIAAGDMARVGLSTGQKKRLALVLARLRRRPVLVLDEWAADQDPERRAWFYDALLPRLRAGGQTIVVITHDDQYFDRCDRGLIFADGRLVEGAA